MSRHVLRRLSAFLTVAVLLVVAGCSQISAQRDSGRIYQTGAGNLLADPAMETVDWGVSGTMVSVLVRNPSNRILRRAEAVISVHDARGETIATSATSPTSPTSPSDSGTPQARSCCTAVEVPPGATYGFYFDVGARADDVAGVTLDYSDLAWSGQREPGGPAAQALPVGLDVTGRTTVVEADVATTGGKLSDPVLQAVLEDADGRLLAVVSGRWPCLLPGPVERVRLELYHPVPPGTWVSSVSVFADAGSDGQPRTSDPSALANCSD